MWGKQLLPCTVQLCQVETWRQNWLSGPVAQRIRHLTTNQGIAGSSPARVNFFFQCLKCKKRLSPPGGLEPPTFRLTAERASRLRHGGVLQSLSKMKSESADHLNFWKVKMKIGRS